MPKIPPPSSSSSPMPSWVLHSPKPWGSST
ncbi:hypothetical protein NXF25_007438 [Crotalus adamanteus]|uniref:Uncharacterized protein n=1 Tax=Crotalus adamanteus TaxID=8729 RepID=A0AAW1C294_CROAD